VLQTRRSGERIPQFSVLLGALAQKSGRDLTPKVLANFSPGFPTLGQLASIELLTLKEFHPVP
jgi:hypothetical protein